MMRRWFQGLPVRQKLVVITLTSSAVALLLAAGGFLTWDILQNRNDIWTDARGQVRILAENSTAPLAFGDARAAGETLAVLELRPRVEMGCTYTAAGAVFATYHRGTGSECPPMPQAGEDFGWRRLTMVVPVTLDNRPVGMLLLQRDLDDVRDRLAIGIATLAVLLVIATVVGLLVGSSLQRTFTQPLLDLAGTARIVSASKDYSLRATPSSTDEVGIVVHAFNDMLDQVEERTTQLSRINSELEREVEERKRMEAERTVLLTRERDANRLKDEFLATLSHELRTPLNAVLGWVRLLRSANVPPGTESRALESIERNARAQARLIEDLLEISRIVTGKLRLQVKAIDLAAIVDAAVEVVQPAAAAKRIQLARNIQTRPAMTSGDPDRLQQIVWNLLSNAVKFTPPGGRITVTLARDHGYVVTVSDSGIGIDPAFLPHIFEMFRQADGSPSREHGGLGLGLAIVRQLAELHGGSVIARSAGASQGSTFEVRLPSDLTVRGEKPRPGVSAPDAPEVPADLLYGIDALVVDDEEDARELMRMTLESYGAHVRTAAGAGEAVAAFEQQVPDVLISDIGMAGEDGYALIARIRSRPTHQGGEVPAVALTAYASEADRERTRAAGYDAHVAKPFEPSSIAALVRELANTHTPMR